MTRARQHLYLVRAFRRAFSGHNPPSRFLADIPPDLVTQSERATQAQMFAPRRYRHVVQEEGERPALPADSFAAGDHVRHPKFGEGIVVSSEPSGTDYQVVVAFQGEAGIKKLLLSFAPLEKLEA
jgi:DNA helicase-2/ATP-dependent DNA helicase PcrA